MLTVSKALDQYYREHVAIKCISRWRAENCIMALKRHIGSKELADIDIPLSRKYADKRRAEGVTDSTIRRELGVLQAAANHAIRWKRLTLDRKPSIERTAESPSRAVWLQKPELAHFLDIAAETDRRVFRFSQLAYHTASRKRAIETLPWSRVDIASRRIDLRNPEEPLTKKRRPIVPISEGMAAELAAMKEKATTPLVLVNDDDIRLAFQHVAKVAGLHDLPKDGLREAGRLTPHILRHSRATHLLEAGKSPWAVASLLGDTLPTVMRVYGHACPNYLEEAIL